MTKSLESFIEKRKSLFWDINSKNLILLSQEAVVERILSFGNMTDVRELEVLLGKSGLRSSYKEISTKKRKNLRPETVNFFNIYFKLNAS
jgi:hypothetical protein